jgi:hypothetical protein
MKILGTLALLIGLLFCKWKSRFSRSVLSIVLSQEPEVEDA